MTYSEGILPNISELIKIEDFSLISQDMANYQTILSTLINSDTLID